MSGAQRLDIEVAVDGTQSASGLGQINTAVERTARTLDNLGDRGTAALDSIGTQSTVAAGRNDAATRSIISQVQRQIATMEAGERGTRSYYESMTRLRGANADALGPLLEQLDQVTARQAAARTGLSATANSLGQVGVSARQTAAAMRGVPAQITDIVTSLQGGQAPLTVFLQQGGQLRDMFGSAGGAARGLASGLTSLINPYTLAAAAAAALGLAYYQGSKEADAYNRALVMTGNVAGTSAGQLADMARGISASIGTQGDAAAALAALAGSGAVASKNLQQFGEVAVRAQKTIGLSVDETAKAFADLAKNPVAATQKLNDQYHYLTNAVYEQIKALEQQGRTQEAGEAAQQAFATALTQRTKGIEENLGYVERAWRSAGSVARQAWDSFMNVGRMQTFDQQLASVQEKLKLARSTASSGTGVASDWSEINRASARANVIALEAEEAKLRGLIKARKDAGDAAAATAKREGAANELSDLASKYLDKETQRQNALTAARQKAADASVGVEGKALEKIRADLKSAEAGINAQYAEKSKAKASAIRTEASAYVKLTTAIGERIDATAREVAGLGPMTESQRLQVALDEGVASGKIKLTAAQKTLYEQQIKTLAQNESVIESAKRAALGQAEVAKIYKSIAEEQARSVRQAEDEASRNEDLVRTFGMTKSAIAGVELARLEEQLAQRSSLGLTLDEIEHLEQLIDAKKRSAAAVSSLEELEKQRELWRGIESTAHDTFVSIFDSGKSAFDRLRDTLKNGLLDLLYQMTIKKWIFNIGASVTGAGMGGVANAGDLASMAGATGGMAGGIGSTVSLINSAKNAYTIATQGFAGVTAGMGSGIVSLGTMFGSSALEAFGAGFGSTGLVGAADAAGLYAASGGVGSAGAVTAGAYAGAAVTAAAGIAAGVLGGNLISGQYGSKTTVIGGTGAGAIAGAFMGGPIGAAIGGAIGGLIGGVGNRLFGMGDKRYGDTGITGTLTGTGFSGEEYAKWTQKGGYFRSNKADTDRKAVDPTMSNAFIDTYAAIRNVSATLAETLGVDTSSLASRSQALNINLTGLKTEAERLEAVTKFFEGVGNAIAVELVPNIATFKVGNEELSTTLQRVSQNFAGVDTVLQLIGRSSQEAFGAVGVASIGARESLIKLAGGLDALSNGTAFFSENFLTEAERMGPVLSTVADTLAKLGLSGVKTVEDYKKVALGLDLSSTAGQEMYIKLLALAPAFKAATDYTNQLAVATGDYAAVVKTAAEIASEHLDLQKQLNELTKSEAELLAIQRSSIADVNKALFDQVQAAKAVVSAKDALVKAYDRESAAAQTALDKSKSWVSTLNSLNASFALGNQSVLTPEQKYAEARAQFEKTLAAANAGDTTAQSGLSAAEQAFLTASQVVNASDARYAADYARVLAANDEALKWASAQVDVQQASLDALKAQVSGLITINDSVLTVAQAIANLHAAMGTATGLGVEFTNAPAVAAPVAFSSAPAPVVFDTMRYSAGSNVGSDALVAEIRALNTRLDAQTVEIKGLRADQAKQTGATIQATVESNDKAAKTVVAGVDKSSKSAVWNRKVEYAA